MSLGRHSISTSRSTWSSMPPSFLTPVGDTDEADGDADFHRLVESNALEIDVQQGVADGLILPVHDHGLGQTLAGDVHVKDGVVAGLGVQDAQDLLGIELDGDGFVTRSIDDGGNLAGNAHTAGCILVELSGSGLGYDNFRHGSLISSSGTEWVPLPLLGDASGKRKASGTWYQQNRT